MTQLSTPPSPILFTIFFKDKSSNVLLNRVEQFLVIISVYFIRFLSYNFLSNYGNNI